MPVQVTAEVLSLARVGDYHHLTLAAAGVAEDARPGHFVGLAVGGLPGDEVTPWLSRRAFSIYRARPTGTATGTVEVVFSVNGAGTRWLASRRPYDQVDVVGPLGRPFALPGEPVSCVLVGGGYGAAPLLALAERLRSRGCQVYVAFGAATARRLFGALDARRSAVAVTVTTEDGSAGERGRVSDVLPDVLQRSGAEVVYACGPMGMLRAVAELAMTSGVHCQVAVEEAMACGFGVCMTCVLPVVGSDGQTRMTRACVEGPVFRGDQVRWDAIGHRGAAVPRDCVGAPAVGPSAGGGH